MKSPTRTQSSLTSLRNEFVQDVINALLKENPEFEKYVNNQDNAEDNYHSLLDTDVDMTHDYQTKNKNTEFVSSNNLVTFQTSSDINPPTQRSISAMGQSNKNDFSVIAPIGRPMSVVVLEKTTPSRVMELKQRGTVLSPKPPILSVIKPSLTRSPNYIRNRTWYDGSEYSCPQCQKTYFQHNFLQRHIRTEHGASAPQLSALSAKLKKIQTKCYYECVICTSRVAHAKDAITRHLKITHSLTLRQYEERFVTSTKWYNNNVVKCPHCDMTSTITNELVRHILRKHPNQPVTADDDMQPKQYRCKICGNIIRHRYANILRHIINVHSMKIERYSELYENDASFKDPTK